MEDQLHKSTVGVSGGYHWSTTDTNVESGFVFYGGNYSQETTQKYNPEAYWDQTYWPKQYGDSQNPYWNGHEEAQPSYTDLHTVRRVMRPEANPAGDYYAGRQGASLEHAGLHTDSPATLQDGNEKASSPLDHGSDPVLPNPNRQSGSHNVGESWPGPQAHQPVTTRSIATNTESPAPSHVLPDAHGDRRQEATNATTVLGGIDPQLQKPTPDNVPRYTQWPQGFPVPRQPISRQECAGAIGTSQKESEGDSGVRHRPDSRKRLEPEIKEKEIELTETNPPSPAKKARQSSPGPESPIYSDITISDKDDSCSDTSSESSIEDYIVAATLVQNPKATDEPQQFSTTLPPVPDWFPSQSSISSKCNVVTRYAVTSTAVIGPDLHRMQQTKIELYPRPVRKPTSPDVMSKDKISKGQNIIYQAQKFTPGNRKQVFNRSAQVQILMVNPEDNFPEIVNKSKYPLNKVGTILSQEETLKPKSVYTCCECTAHRWDILFEDTTKVMATSITAASNGSRHLNVSTTHEYHRWDLELPDDSPKNKWNVYISYTNVESKQNICEHYILS